MAMMENIQIEIITKDSPYDLQQKVNRWLEEANCVVLDIKYAIAECQNSIYCSALILYAPRESPESGAEDKEIVICAAVKTATGKIYRGHRHGDCMKEIRDRHYIPGEKPEDQGFITSKNRYVTREKGRKLQDAAGIKSVAPDGYCGSTLYSEDLY